MEHIPAEHAAKVGTRCPARVRAMHESGLFLELDLTLVAPGRSPRLHGQLEFVCTVDEARARELRLGDRTEVTITMVPLAGYSVVVSLPAEPEWLAWDGGTVRQLAQQIRDIENATLLPILADALEEAGCDERELLARCRAPDASENDVLEWFVELLATQE